MQRWHQTSRDTDDVLVLIAGLMGEKAAKKKQSLLTATTMVTEVKQASSLLGLIMSLCVCFFFFFTFTCFSVYLFILFVLIFIV